MRQVREILGKAKTVRELLKGVKYSIDYYQREYKWKADEVKRLVDDIFYHFEQSYAKHGDLDASEQNVTAKYSWYYLNTYITNRTSGRIFVVDGQQRLTTLTLMLVALYRMCGSDGFITRRTCATG